MTPRLTIDLNADLGEGFPNDAALLQLVTSTSISCGAHAGDEDIIRQTLTLARDLEVAVGAHPGYPDRENFGRVERQMTAADVERLILEQCRVLNTVAEELGVPILFLKPHGALYNQAQRDPEIVRGVLAAARTLGWPVLAQPDSRIQKLALEKGPLVVLEGFPDRRYEPNGSLVPRTRPNALLHEPAEVTANVRWLMGQGVETLCIHGDAPQAVASAMAVRETLTSLGVTPRFWGAGH